MHGTAFALAQARRLAEQLGHHLVRIGTSGQALSMVAIGSDHIIVRLKGGDGSDRDGLFADVQMQEPRDFREGIHLRRLFFESADQQHLMIERKQISFVHVGHYAWRDRSTQP